MLAMAAIVAVACIVAFLLTHMARRAARALPPDGPVPLHFNIKGKADGFGHRAFILGLMPAIYISFTCFALVIDYLSKRSSPGEILGLVAGFGLVCLLLQGLIMSLLLRWAAGAAAGPSNQDPSNS